MKKLGLLFVLLLVFTSLGTNHTFAQTTKYEAENAVLSGGASINTNHSGYSGTGFIDGYYNSTTAKTSFNVTVSSYGTYSAKLRYSAGNGTASNIGLYVNGIKIKNITCPQTANWDTWSDEEEYLTLKSGTNTIEYKAETASTNCINLDFLTIDPYDVVCDKEWIKYYYTDGFGIGNNFCVETNQYKMIFDLKNGKISTFQNKNSSISNYLGSNGAYVNILSGGVSYNTLTAQTTQTGNESGVKARVTCGGEYYYHFQVGPFVMKNGTNSLNCVVYWQLSCWSDKIYATVQLAPTSGTVNCTYADITWEQSVWANKYKAGTGSLTATSTYYQGTPTGGISYINDANAGRGSFALEIADYSNTNALINTNGTTIQRYSAGNFSTTKELYCQMACFNDDTTASAVNDWTIETNPLTSSNFTVTGNTNPAPSFAAYDNHNGFYKINFPGKFSFNRYYYYFDSPNEYHECTVTVANDSANRRVRIRTDKKPLISQTSCEGATILCDSNNNPLGIPVQGTTNWGDKPDGPWHRTYFTDTFSASQTKTYKLRQSFQDWGRHININMTSQMIREYDGYDQLWFNITGGMCGFGTCDDLYHPGRPIVNDVSPAGGRPDYTSLWPWMACYHGADTLNYINNSTFYSMKTDTGIVFPKIGPNTAQTFSELRSSDGKAKASVMTYELAVDKNHSRVYKIRYDFTGTISISNPTTDLRLFTLGNRNAQYHKNDPTSVCFKNISGSTSVINDNVATHWPVNGQVLNTSYPYVQLLGCPGANIGALVRNVSGRMDNSAVNQLMFSWEKIDQNDDNAAHRSLLHLAPYKTGSFNINAGDYIELELVVFQVARNRDSVQEAQNIHGAWGSNYNVAVTSGTLVSSLPANIKVDSNGNADFTLQGGTNFVPVTISSASTYLAPKLYEKVKNAWVMVDQAVNGNDFWQTDYNPSTGKYDITYLIKADGSTRTFKFLSAGSPPSDTYSSNSLDGTVSPYALFFKRYVHGGDRTMTFTAECRNTGSSSWSDTNKAYMVIEVFGQKYRKQLGTVASHSNKVDTITVDIANYNENNVEEVYCYIEAENGTKISNTVPEHVMVYTDSTKFRILSPDNGALNTGTKPIIKWEKVYDNTGVSNYTIFLYDSPYMINPVYTYNVNAESIAANKNNHYQSYTIPDTLSTSIRYYIKIAAKYNDGRIVENYNLPYSFSAGTTGVTGNKVCWLNFEETMEPVGFTGQFTSRVAYDSSGKGNNASIYNSARWVPGKTGTGVGMNNDGYAVLPAGIVSSLNDFSISAWVRANKLMPWSRIWEFGTNGGTTNYMELVSSDANGKIRFSIQGTGSEQYIQSSSAMPLNEWVHITVTKSGNTYRLYMNGTEVGVNTNVTLKPSDLGSTPNNYIARPRLSQDVYFSGSVDDLRIYNITLSPTDIGNIINEAKNGSVVWYNFDEIQGANVKDSSSRQTNDGTLSGDASFASNTERTSEENVLNLGGTNGYVNLLLLHGYMLIGI